MAHKVKCLYCGQSFDRDTVDNIKIGRRYAHSSCEKKKATENNDNEDWVKKIFALVKEVYNGNYNYIVVEKQRQKFLKEGMTNEGIYKTLYYHYKIKNGNPDTGEGRIGIVPFLYDEAKNYYSNLSLQEMKMERVKNSLVEEKIVTIKTKIMEVPNIRDVRKINLEDLE